MKGLVRDVISVFLALDRSWSSIQADQSSEMSAPCLNGPRKGAKGLSSGKLNLACWRRVIALVAGSLALGTSHSYAPVWNGIKDLEAWPRFC